MAGHFTAGQFYFGDIRINGGIVLNGSLEFQIRAKLFYKPGGFLNLVDIGSLAGFSCRIRQHRNTWLDPETLGRIRRADSDVRQLFGIWIRVDRTIAIHQNPVRETHEKNTRNNRTARSRPDKLEGRADRVLRRMYRPGDHAVGNPAVDHHGSEVADVGHGVKGHLERYSLVFADFEIGLSKIFTKLRSSRIDDFHIGKGQSEGRNLFSHLTRVPQQRNVHNIPQTDDFRSPENPFLRTFGQNDASAFRSRSAHEIVLEHQRCYARRAHDGDATLQSIQVDIGFEYAEGSGDFAMILRGDSRLYLGDRCCRRKGVGPHIEDRNRGTFQAFQKSLHLGRRLQAAGQDDGGDPRI